MGVLGHLFLSPQRKEAFFINGYEVVVNKYNSYLKSLQSSKSLTRLNIYRTFCNLCYTLKSDDFIEEEF